MPVAQTFTVTSIQKNPFADAVVPFQIMIDWSSATGGGCSGAIASTYTAALASKSANPIVVSKIQGIFRQCQTIPGVHGDKSTSCPSTAYTLAITDAYGDDILDNIAVLTPRSTSVSEKLVPATKRIIDSELTVTITTAGDGKYGRIILEFEDMGYAKL